MRKKPFNPANDGAKTDLAKTMSYGDYLAH